MSIPITIIWDLTAKCNLKCIHCFNVDRYTSPFYGTKNELSTTDAKLAIDKFSDAGVKHLHLLGGEPLFRKDVVEILTYAKKKNLVVSINTNGVLLDEHFSQKLLDIGIDQVVVSIDGATSKTNDLIRGRGTYKRIIKNMVTLKEMSEKYENEMNAGIAFTLLKQNLHEAPSMLDLADSLKVDVIDIMELYISGRAKEEEKRFKYSQKERIEILEKVAKKIRERKYSFLVQMDIPLSLVKYLNWRYSIDIFFHSRNMGCKAGEEMWYMQAEGRVLPCGMVNNPLYSNSLVKKKVYILENLNILEVKDLEEIENSGLFKTFQEFKNKMKEKYRRTCSSCRFNEECSPCPIVYYDYEVIPECEAVFKREKDFINMWLNKTVYLRHDIHYKKNRNGVIKVWDKKYNNYRKIGGSGKLIWNSIVKQNKKVKELVHEVSSYYTIIPSIEEIKRDTVKFIYELYLSDWIEIL